MAIILESIGAYDVDIGTSIYFDLTPEHQGFEIQYTEMLIYTEAGLPICRHKETGDYKIHTLPAKDDSTIQYYSEERKAWYVNGKRYRMTLMIKLVGVPILYAEDVTFYCFQEPKITFLTPSYGETDTIYAPAYTFSVDVKITYPYPALVSQTNKIQKYEFYLWDDDTGEGIQESGQILGTGTSIGSEVVGDKIVYTYNIKHTFGDLEPNISYRAEIIATTEVGTSKDIMSEGLVKYTETAGTSMFRSVGNVSSRGAVRVSDLDIMDSDVPDKVKIERIATDEDKWMEVATLPYQGWQTTLIDTTVENGVTYTYRPVLIYNIDGFEYEVKGIGENVKCCFEGVIVADAESFIKLDTAIYTGMQVQQTIGVHQPLGSKYPIVVVNSKTSYHTGSVGGKVLNSGFGKKNPSTKKYEGFDAGEAVKMRKEIDAFLTNKKPKILKDDIGNSFIVMITEAPTYEFAEWSNALASINFNYAEIGDPSNSDDIKRTGILGGVV